MPRDLGSQQPHGEPAAAAQDVNVHHSHWAPCAGPRLAIRWEAQNFVHRGEGTLSSLCTSGILQRLCPCGQVRAICTLARGALNNSLAMGNEDAGRQRRQGAMPQLGHARTHPSFCTHLVWVVGSTPS